MRQTSLSAFQEEKESGRLGDRCKEVYLAIKRNPYRTDREIAKILGYQDPNAVRPRRYDLLKQGLIQEDEKRQCKVTGKTSCTWVVL